MYTYSTPHSRYKSRNEKPVCAGGKTVGYVRGDTFYKTIRGSVHIMRTPRAIFFDVQSLMEAQRLGAKFVHVTDSETDRVYRAPIALIFALPVYRNYGFGEQVGLALNQFNRGDVSEPRNVPKQIELF